MLMILGFLLINVPGCLYAQGEFDIDFVLFEIYQRKQH